MKEENITSRINKLFRNNKKFVIPLIILITLSNIFQIRKISGESMNPTLKSKNIAISIKPKNINRGDIVGIIALNKKLCKRVVAIPEDVVYFDLEKNLIYVNGEKESYKNYKGTIESNITKGYKYFLTKSYESNEYRLKEDEYLVLGDNRGDSKDGRNFGYISKENIICEFIFIFPLGFN